MKRTLIYAFSLLATLGNAEDLKPAAWVPLPAVGSSPETGFQYGAYVMRIFEQTQINEPQNRLELLLQGTTEGQYQAYIWPNIFVDQGKWNIKGQLGGRYWPSGYFGQSNNAEDSYDQYADTTIEGSITTNYLLTPAVRFGLSARIENHQIDDIEDTEGTESELLSASVVGVEGGLYSGVGAELIYDRRDNIDWPTQGQLATIQWDLFSKSLGSDYDFNVLKLKATQYVALASDVLAISSQVSQASDNTPFTHLPRPSGDRTLRGANGNRWIDNTSLGFQAEYRKPLSTKWAAVGFFDSVQVAPSLEEIQLIDFHYSIGAGVRFAMTPDRFNIRFDIGYVDLETVSFAITVGEAF
jgi:outer membrane protein assembly factor BamA